MTLVLFESAAGLVLASVTDSGILKDPSQARKKFADTENVNSLLSLKSIRRFQSTADAVEEYSSLGEGKLSSGLKKFLQEEISGAGAGAGDETEDGSKKKKSKKSKGVTAESAPSLIVSDPKLGGAIAKKLGITVLSETAYQDLFRGIRENLAALLAEHGVDESDLSTMALGLSHSLSRYKLKFSPDKVDTMIVQAIALLDDLDKEINIYAMRVKEWYGWHFPEMAKILSDNLAYAKVVKKMGLRTNAAETDFSEILPEDLEEVLKAAAVISMGTEISVSDLQHIHLLCDQVISITQYRSELYSYLVNRMTAIAPNLTALVGELVGARLIAHAGSLMTLAKHPASTIQILGAEKALFRALKTKHDTPKYGLIFHASLVGQAPQKLKGKMARMVATKTALSVRIDALSDADTKSAEDAPIAGIENRAKLESRLRALEQGMGITSTRRGANGTSMNSQPKRFEMMSNGGSYNPAADTLIPSQVAAPADAEMEVDGDVSKKAKKEKKDKKRKREAEADFQQEASAVEDAAPAEDPEKAERKRRKREEKLASKAAKLDKKAAAEIGDASLVSVANGDTTKADESILTNGDASERKEKKDKKKKEKKSKKEAEA